MLQCVAVCCRVLQCVPNGAQPCVLSCVCTEREIQDKRERERKKEREKEREKGERDRETERDGRRQYCITKRVLHAIMSDKNIIKNT